MSPQALDGLLDEILRRYKNSFVAKVFNEVPSGEDDLMLVFGLTQLAKAQNKQYWGRELGMCWQRLVIELFRQNRPQFGSPIQVGSDEICDLVSGKDAIDTKYRIGSGDSGTLKKFKQYGRKLRGMGFNPILLILRTDNLPAAITACKTGGWTTMIGNDAYKYISAAAQFDLQGWLKSRKNKYAVAP